MRKRVGERERKRDEVGDLFRQNRRTKTTSETTTRKTRAAAAGEGGSRDGDGGGSRAHVQHSCFTPT